MDTITVVVYIGKRDNRDWQQKLDDNIAQANNKLDERMDDLRKTCDAQMKHLRYKDRWSAFLNSLINR